MRKLPRKFVCPPKPRIYIRTNPYIYAWLLRAHKFFLYLSAFKVGQRPRWGVFAAHFAFFYFSRISVELTIK